MSGAIRSALPASAIPGGIGPARSSASAARLKNAVPPAKNSRRLTSHMFPPLLSFSASPRSSLRSGHEGLEDAPAGLYAQVVGIPAEKSAFPDRAVSRSRRFSSRRLAMLVLYWVFGRDFALRASEF